MFSIRLTTTIGFLAAMFALGLTASPTAQAASGFYQQQNLVSDVANSAANTDPNLINGWGVAFNPFGFVWIADNGTGVSTLYDGNGKPQSLVVTVPGPTAGSKGTPTGIVFSGGPGFLVTQGTVSGPSRFIFATEDGILAGWAPNVDPTHAIKVVDNSKSSGAVYKGLALSAGGSGNRLYAADFHNNRVDVFNDAFKSVDNLASGAFVDPLLPNGFAPFGIQAINGNIYVAYAKQDAAKHDEIPGKGLGVVDVFDPNGILLRRVATHGALNAPWGMTLAPAGFGRFSNRLLIGNFGNGQINAYDLATGHFAGKLRASDRRPIQINGLWGLAFGNGFQNQLVNTLFFAAGPNDEQHGLYGRIDVMAGEAMDDAEEQEGGDN